MGLKKNVISFHYHSYQETALKTTRLVQNASDLEGSDYE